MTGVRQRKAETPNTQSVTHFRLYTANHEVGVDVFEIIDPVGTRFSILNAV